MTNAKLVGPAQTLLSVLFLLGYFGLLWLFLSGKYLDPTEWRDAVIALLGVVTGSVGTIVSFWFNRSRPQEQPEYRGPGMEGAAEGCPTCGR